MDNKLTKRQIREIKMESRQLEKAKMIKEMEELSIYDLNNAIMEFKKDHLHFVRSVKEKKRRMWIYNNMIFVLRNKIEDTKII